MRPAMCGLANAHADELLGDALGSEANRAAITLKVSYEGRGK
jgi:hypothetical protein